MLGQVFITNNPAALCMSVGGGIRILATFPVDGREAEFRPRPKSTNLERNMNRLIQDILIVG